MLPDVERQKNDVNLHDESDIRRQNKGCSIIYC
jgi:hypothetical protein